MNSMITFASDRFVEVELLDNAREGLKIPNSSIATKDFYIVPKDFVTVGASVLKIGISVVADVVTASPSSSG